MTFRPGHFRIISALILISLLLMFPARVSALAKADVPPLDEFIAEVMNGEADVLRGVYIPGVLANSVVLQPEKKPAYVSSNSNTLTKFALASRYGSTGLLAHNYLAGKSFFLLESGQLIYLIYGDGRTEAFIVTQLMRFQALDPDNATSNFVDLDDGEVISASGLFLKAYNRPGHVILQTCINVNGNSSWGRLFITAEPYDEIFNSMSELNAHE